MQGLRKRCGGRGLSRQPNSAPDFGAREPDGWSAVRLIHQLAAPIPRSSAAGRSLNSSRARALCGRRLKPFPHFNSCTLRRPTPDRSRRKEWKRSGGATGKVNLTQLKIRLSRQKPQPPGRRHRFRGHERRLSNLPESGGRSPLRPMVCVAFVVTSTIEIVIVIATGR